MRYTGVIGRVQGTEQWIFIDGGAAERSMEVSIRKGESDEDNLRGWRFDAFPGIFSVGL